jgi:PAS domain S-box-containing protein
MQARLDTPATDLHEHFRLLLEHMPDVGIALLNGDGRVISWNREAEQIAGYKEDEVLEKDCSIFYTREDQSVNKPAALLQIAAERGACEDEGLRVRKDGSRFAANVKLIALRKGGGPILGFASLTRDITQRKISEAEHARLLEREQTARTIAEKANKMKDEFLALCSHELRTPLTPMLGWIRLLRTSAINDPKSFAHGLEIIERNVNIEAQLIEDLLDVSRIMSGKLRLETDKTDLIPVINSAIDAVGSSAEHKAIKIDTELDPAVGEVMGDSARLQQVIWNLLSNAIKFTPKDGTIQVRMEREGSNVKIIVSDNGEGIDPGFLPHVFDRFRQAESGLTRHHGGLGLGLAIVKSLVELHGGSIHAESPGKGKGATFSVLLPLRHEAVSLPQRSVLRPVAQIRTDHPLRGLTVLAVDDERDTREFLAFALKLHGAKVSTASSAEEAFKLLESIVPDLLLCDIGMPQQDGYALIQRIRGLSSALANVPAIALTAFAKSEDRDEALVAGFQQHIPKPVHPEQLVQIILEVTGERSEP